MRAASTSSSVTGAHASVPVGAPPEAELRSGRVDAERLGAHRRRGGRVLERAADALRLAPQHAGFVGDGGRDDEADGDREDRDDHEDLDQREAGRARAGARGAGPGAQRSQDPMSASTPVPPGWPSAPKLITSISPRSPGLRYWYGRPHGSFGTFSR